MADKEQCIGSFTAFLSRTMVEVEKVLGRLKWTKDKLLKEAGNSKLVQCPFNQNHLMSPRHLKKHVKVCQYASEGLDPQGISSSPAFFYQSSKMATPIFIGERQYSYFKNWKEGTIIEVPKEDDVLNTKALRAQHSDQRLQEEQPRLSDRKMKNIHIESMDNERSIMAWNAVPASHQTLELSLLPQQKIRRWIIENLPQVQYLSSVDGASDSLVNFVLSCLQETSVAHPAGMEKMLTDLLGNETQSFVLKLWKFLAVSIACVKMSTKEANAEAPAQGDLGGPTRLDSSEHAPVDPTQTAGIPVPMERVVSELTPQQRLALYEHVIQTSKAAREDDERKEKLDDIADVNNTQGDEDDLPKSHLEMLAERRDYKRRRQSYRAKNVHITKRSAVEVMRDLIETQMHVLEMQMKGEHDTSRTNSDEEDKCLEDKPSRDNKQSGEDYSRGDSRGYEKWRPDRNRDRKRDKEGGKRTRHYDSRESEVKRSRRQ